MAADNKDEEKIIAEIAKLDKVFKGDGKKVAQDLKNTEKLIKEIEKRAKE